MPVSRASKALFALALCAGASLLFAGWRGDDAHTLERADATAPRASPSPLPAPGEAPRGDAGDDRGARSATASAEEPLAAPDPSPAFTRSMLAAAIEARLPGLLLSDTELDGLADATLRMREAQQALRALPNGPSESAARVEARRQLEKAIGDFHYIAEMSPAEFTRRVGDAGPLRALPGGSDDEILLRPLTPRAGRR